MLSTYQPNALQTLQELVKNSSNRNRHDAPAGAGNPKDRSMLIFARRNGHEDTMRFTELALASCKDEQDYKNLRAGVLPKLGKIADMTFPFDSNGYSVEKNTWSLLMACSGVYKHLPLHQPENESPIFTPRDDNELFSAKLNEMISRNITDNNHTVKPGNVLVCVEKQGDGKINLCFSRLFGHEKDDPQMHARQYMDAMVQRMDKAGWEMEGRLISLHAHIPTECGVKGEMFFHYGDYRVEDGRPRAVVTIMAPIKGHNSFIDEQYYLNHSQPQHIREEALRRFMTEDYFDIEPWLRHHTAQAHRQINMAIRGVDWNIQPRAIPAIATEQQNTLAVK